MLTAMASTDDRPAFARAGRDWPNREASRFVTAGGLTWHVQEAGEGPVLLLVHGTGAATHSWRGLMPLLARDFRVIAPDLPGHGFTDPLRTPSLPRMARALAELLRVSMLGRRSRRAIPRAPRSWRGSASTAPWRRASSSGSTRHSNPSRGWPASSSRRWPARFSSIRSRRGSSPGRPTGRRWSG